MVAWAYRSPHRKHVDRFVRFCTAHGYAQQTDGQTDKQTDTQTDHGTSVAIGCIFEPCACDAA